MIKIKNRGMDIQVLKAPLYSTAGWLERVFYTLFLLTIFFAGFGQTSILDVYIKEGVENNLSIKTEAFERQKQLSNIALAKTNFAPKVSFSPTYTLAAGGRKLEFPIGDLLNPVYSTLNQITKSSSFPQVENVSQQLAPNNFQDTKISFQYPIFNSDIQYNYLIQKHQMSGVDAKRAILINDVKYNIKTTYYQFLQAKDAEKVLIDAKNMVLEAQRFNQKLVKNQVATKDILIGTEYELAKIEGQVALLNKHQQTAASYLNFLMNRPFSSEIIVDSMVIKQVPLLGPLDQYLKAGQRSEFDQLQSGIDASNTLIKMYETAAKRPQVFIGGSTGFQGFGYKFKNQAYLLSQIGLNFDLYHGYEKKQKINAAKIASEQLMAKKSELEKQIELQITQAYFETENAIKQQRVAKQGVEKALQYYTYLNTKYLNGQALYIEVDKARNDLTIARQFELNASYDILIKKSLLDKTLSL